MAAPMGLPPVSRHTASHPCRIPTAFFVKYDAQLFTFDTNFFFKLLLSTLIKIAPSDDCPTFAAMLDLLVIIAITVPRSLALSPGCRVFFVLLLLPRLHSIGASGKSANDGGAGGLEMHYRSEPACFQDFSTVARRTLL